MGLSALLICDLQQDYIGSLVKQDSLLTGIDIALEVIRRRNSINKNSWIIIYSGLRFNSGYEGVSPSHKLYGGLKKLNEKLGDEKVHWFMEGFSGSKIVTKPCNLDDTRVVWRSKHVPYELISLIKKEGVDKVYITGAKASTSVQISMQMLMDEGVIVSAIKECIQDSDQKVLEATLDHILPIYGNVVSLKEFVDDVGDGIDNLSENTKQSLLDLLAGGDGTGSALLACDCGRRGHGTKYMQLLMKRGGWKMYPTQVWYEDFIQGEFYCPMFKKIVDFCDEPEFSKVSMYLAGREFLDEKDKVISIAGKFMPKTYCIQNGKFIGEPPPLDTADGATDVPWFVKEADKNLGGAAISIVSKPSEILNVIDEDQRYVVQQHIRRPLLTDDGRKAHLKFYVLLIGESDGFTWRLYTYLGALLSISPCPWSPFDLSHDTQITIHRHPEPPTAIKGWGRHWTSVYTKCKAATTEVIKKAITEGKLKGRRKKQFEVFSVDWMPDELGNIWMFEFNMSPAVAQKEFDDPSVRDDRRNFLMEHDEMMLQEALAIVFPCGDNIDATGQWELAAEFMKSNSA
jgi:hypothetical protein